VVERVPPIYTPLAVSRTNTDPLVLNAQAERIT
jgi:hypothetical protein